MSDTQTQGTGDSGDQVDYKAEAERYRGLAQTHQAKLTDLEKQFEGLDPK